MKLSFRSSALCTATVAGLLVLTACGKKEEQQNTAPAAASTAPATPAPAAPAPAPATTAAAAPAPAAPPAAAPAAPVAASDTLKVGSVTLGSAVGADKKVAKAKNAFLPTDKTIFASVATEGTTAGATLNAKWTYQDGDTTT
ncbi:MAG TPA: hypothetical protein VN813_14435, partial [Luteibacter sp.]|nr:hypothetical protein [Luteibacter sp.]